MRRLSGPTAVPSRPHAILLQDQADPAPINQIRTGLINGRSALMTVDDGGHVNVFWIEVSAGGLCACDCE